MADLKKCNAGMFSNPFAVDPDKIYDDDSTFSDSDSESSTDSMEYEPETLEDNLPWEVVDLAFPMNICLDRKHRVLLHWTSWILRRDSDIHDYCRRFLRSSNEG